MFLVGPGWKEVLAFLGGFGGLWKLECSLSSLAKQALLELWCLSGKSEVTSQVALRFALAYGALLLLDPVRERE